jgi:hypothetical protein
MLAPLVVGEESTATVTQRAFELDELEIVFSFWHFVS